MGFPRKRPRSSHPPIPWRFEGFSRQFDNFDPLKGAVPATPLSSLPLIAARARTLLGNRTRRQLRHAAATADWLIDQYFHQQRIPGRVNPYRELADEDWRAKESARWLTRGSVSSATALAESLSRYRLDNDPQFRDGQDYEYLAVFGIWKIADVILRLPSPGVVYSTAEDSGVWEPEHSLWAEDAVAAMEATCWAERLKDQTSRVEQLVQEAVKKRISLTAQRAAVKRHTETRQLKSEAFEYYRANQHRFKSMDAAAEAIAGKIVPLKFRTVRSWIPEFRGALQSARTP